MMLQAWGKTDKDSGEFHPLAHHSMDVAAVLARMLQLPVVRDRLEAAADAALTESMCERLAALAFLHDIGKLYPGFQAKGWADGIWRRPTTGHLKESWAFLMLAVQWPEHPFHGTIQRILDWGEAVSPLMGAMFAHHGRPVEPPSAPTLLEWPSLTHYDWRIEARRMGDALQRWFPAAFESGGEHLPGTPRFCHEVAGLSALADWIGSDTAVLRVRSTVRVRLRHSGARHCGAGADRDRFRLPRARRHAAPELPGADRLSRTESGAGQRQAASTRMPGS